jgi:hypothetical protein
VYLYTLAVENEVSWHSSTIIDHGIRLGTYCTGVFSTANDERRGT